MIHKTLCRACRPKHPSLLLDKLLEKLKTVLMLLSLPVRRLCDLCACSVPTHWTFSLWWLLYPGDYVMSDVILWHHLPSSIAPEMSISPIFEHRVTVITLKYGRFAGLKDRPIMGIYWSSICHLWVIEWHTVGGWCHCRNQRVYKSGLCWNEWVGSEHA